VSFDEHVSLPDEPLRLPDVGMRPRELPEERAQARSALPHRLPPLDCLPCEGEAAEEASGRGTPYGHAGLFEPRAR
jgi:hypothetical protein